MSKNLKILKTKLTITFSVIVFLVIFVFWLVFFSSKYFQIKNNDYRSFSNVITSVEKWSITLNDILRVGNFRFDGHNMMKKIDDWSMKNLDMPKLLLNYIYLDSNNNVLFSNIKENIKYNILEKIILSEWNYNKIYDKDSYYFSKLKLNNWNKLVLIKKHWYGFFDYINDMFFYTMISLFFSFFIYFIWLKFIDKIFLPVEENIKDMKNFIHNAGHELKTPISIIDSNSQLMLELNKWDISMIKEIKNEANKLNWLIDWLISLSDIGHIKSQSSNKLLDLINEVISNYQKEINDKKIKVNINIWSNIVVKSNKNYLFIFLSNIVWNAIKYSNNKWIIDINYKGSELYIKDNWIWISNNDLSHIWDRFYKADKSRNTKWYWIWLSIVKKISEIYWWEINVDSKLWEYTIFKIKF